MKYTYVDNSKSFFTGKKKEVTITADSRVEAEHKLLKLNDFGRDPKWKLKNISEQWKKKCNLRCTFFYW